MPKRTDLSAFSKDEIVSELNNRLEVLKRQSAADERLGRLASLHIDEMITRMQDMTSKLGNSAW